MVGFKEGYSFFEKNSGTHIAAQMGNDYIDNINQEIENLKDDLNSFHGYNTNASALKGDVAEFWHSDTFNINAVIKGSNNRTYVDRSHDFASPDISSNFGDSYGLKYYKTGVDSAKQQAKSIFERYKEYHAQGGKDSLEVFLNKRGYDNIDTMLSDPIYSGQYRVIPKDQLEEATKWLQKKILEESVKRTDQIERYQETLDMLTDRLRDCDGTESIALTADAALNIARLSKKGDVTDKELQNLGLEISTEELVRFKYIMKQAFKAGTTAATISMVLKVAPEVYKAISYLIKTGELDEEQFKGIGFAALQGSAEGFVRGSISAALTSACKAGLMGGAWKQINPSVIGAVTVVTMDTMKNAFYVATGKMETRELTSELIKEMFISTCSLVSGGITQSLIQLPVLGFMLGSFLGSVAGSFAYNVGVNAILSFCTDTGFTMFGLVKQNYKISQEVLNQMGIETFEYEKFNIDKFNPEKFCYQKFSYNKFEINTLNIKCLRRGVISVNQIGYV